MQGPHDQGRPGQQTTVQQAGTGEVQNNRDVSASHPEIVESLLSRMEEVQRTVFDPDRGLRDLQGACKSLERNGAFWSPWLTPEELPHEMQLQQMAAVVPGLE
jgi:hypothetical protein